MTGWASVFRRELGGYFATPVAYVFIVIFLILAGVSTFQLGGFFARGQADLAPFFNFHPWLYLFLIPALSMRLWAEERRSGTIELLLTLPISPSGAVVGKYLAAWLFAGIALARGGGRLGGSPGCRHPHILLTSSYGGQGGADHRAGQGAVLPQRMHKEKRPAGAGRLSGRCNA